MDHNLRKTIKLLTFIIVISNSNFLIQAQQRPKIIEHPADSIAAREEPLTLNCKATGRPAPEIQWYHNATPLIPSERRVVLTEGSLFFLRVLENKREQDSGIYWCEARSPAGIAVSKNATLQIASLKDNFRSVPKDTIALVGGPVTMNCTPPRGLPEPSVLWYKDSILLEMGKRISLIEEGSILISEVQPSDAGSYVCSAQNMAGSKSTSAATLKVLTPPTIIRAPQDTEVIEGEGFDIPCEIKGDPKPSVGWYRENAQLPEGRSRTLLDNTLRIEDARAEDQGKYTCNGYNEGGNVSMSIKISVYATPSFTEAPSDVEVPIGEPVKIPCRASGRPKTVIIWDRVTDGTKLKDLNWSQLLEEEEKLHQESKAKIMSFRSKRLATPHRTLRSVLLPEDTEDFDLLENTFSEVPAITTLNVGSTLLPQLDLIRYTVTENGDFEINSVQKDDEGWYACSAINEAGSVSKKVYLHVKDSVGAIEFETPDPPGNRWGSPQTILITAITPISFSTIDVSWMITVSQQNNLFTDKPIHIYYRPIIPKKQNYSCVLNKDYLWSSSTVDKKAHRLKDLKPFTVYEIFAAMPTKGLGGSISNLRKGKTLDGPPTAPPTEVRVGVINTTAAYVRWSPPPIEQINGELTGYKIQIKSNLTNKLLGQMSLNATTQSVVINSLSPGGRYFARVAPLTAGGLGPYSEPAPLHMDPSFIARPPKTDPATNTWKSTWMPGIALAILGICLISGAGFVVFWAKRNKRNLKASYPTGPMLPNPNLQDKSFNALWMNSDTTLKPTNFHPNLPPVPSEYAEVQPLAYPPKLPQNPPPEPYATVTLQRNNSGANILHSDEKKSQSKFSLSQCSSDYNTNSQIRAPLNICDMLPPPPDHPYDSYHKPMIQQPNNMTIRTNPAALSPQILRKGGINNSGQSPMIHQQHSPMWNTLPEIPPAPPIPSFPQNWTPNQRQMINKANTNGHIPYHHTINNGFHMQKQMQQQQQQSDNDYESGSVLYEQFCRENEQSYFTGSGEPTEQYYRNVNMEFFEDQEFEPGTPPPPCPPDPFTKNGSMVNGLGTNSNLRLLINNQRNTMSDQFANQKRNMYNRNISRDSSVDRTQQQQLQLQQQQQFIRNQQKLQSPSSDDTESEGTSGDSKWNRSRRSRSRSKSNERRFRDE